MKRDAPCGTSTLIGFKIDASKLVEEMEPLPGTGGGPIGAERISLFHPNDGPIDELPDDASREAARPPPGNLESNAWDEVGRGQ